MRLFNWILLNGGFLVVGYCGLFMGIAGAWNITVFMIWVCFIFSLFLFADVAIDKLSERGRSVPQIVSVTCDILVLLVLVWFGHWWLGFMYLFQLIMQEGAWQRAECA